jgi:hypothetical protein
MVLGAAAEKRARAGPLMPRRCAAAEKRVRAGVSRGSAGASGCVVSKTYRHRSYKDSAWECRYFSTVGPRELAGKEKWWGEFRMESGC